MKARTPPIMQTRKQFVEEVRREYEKCYGEHQNDIQKSLVVQFMAVVLYTLNVCEDYGTKRLRRVFDEINSTFEDMSGVGFAGRFDTGDLVAHCKEKFGIDLVAEISVEDCKPKGGKRCTKNSI